MQNIFILYIPRNNYEALVHYQDTIKDKVKPDRVFNYINSDLKSKLKSVFGNKDLTIWGSRDSEANKSKFDKMSEGDYILIVEGDTIKLLGKVAAKTINKGLSAELWKNLKVGRSESWDLIYFIANPKEIGLPFSEFCKLFGYSENYQLRGFTTVADDRLEEFYSHYDDLYSILERLKKGEKVFKLEEGIKDSPGDGEPSVYDSETEVSQHIQMQYKLIKLGEKLGTKVWLPRNDQTRVQKEYGNLNFDKEFTSGLDVPRSVEDIDVVWKDEYRIDAAFEVENSTSVYSGLLRFSDLKVMTPNSTYPLYIVAPISRRQKVFREANRPTFNRLRINRDVKFIPYEIIDDLSESKEKVDFKIIHEKAESVVGD